MARMDQIGKTATKVRTVEGVTHVQYHATDVVSFDDKTVTLRTGGYFTLTTKTRMNQTANQFGLGFQVYQKKGDWFVSFADGRDTAVFVGTEFTFSR